MGNCYIYLNTSEVTIRTFIIFEIKSFKCFCDLYRQLCCLYMIGHLVPPPNCLREESLLN